MNLDMTYTEIKTVANANPRWKDAIFKMQDQPKWITEPMSYYDIQAVNHGGCFSGAYMPAVINHQALETMNKYGDEVMDYIIEYYDYLPESDEISWSSLACFYLSVAVQVWCNQFEEK